MKDKPALKWWAAKQAAIFAAEKYESLESLSKEERIDLIRVRHSGRLAARLMSATRSTTGSTAMPSIPGNRR